MRLLPLLLARAAQACTVCFGGGEGRLSQGLTWGILLLITVTFSILAVLTIAVLRIEKRRASMEASS